MQARERYTVRNAKHSTDLVPLEHNFYNSIIHKSGIYIKHYEATQIPIYIYIYFQRLVVINTFFVIRQLLNPNLPNEAEQQRTRIIS